MAEFEKKVRQILKDNGCSFVRHGKGDHDIWYSPITNKNIAVDTVIKSRHTANAIMKQSGIDYHFQLAYAISQTRGSVSKIKHKLKLLSVMTDDES